MNEIEKELKLSKKQNYNDRYNYLCSQFNDIEYAIKLEKYTNKLLKENKQLKQQLKDKDEKISKAIETIKGGDWHDIDVYIGEDLLEILERNKEE